jgi:methionyl-tRNA synthetase
LNPVKKFFITTAIDYVNSRPHLGTAYEKIGADVIARYKRLAGFDVHFLMGNDEHSQNVFRKAKELGEEPLAYCDRMAREFLDVWKRLDISFDDFVRTTEPRHRAGVQELIRRITDAGDIYEGHYEGWYCVSCEAFKQEKDLIEGLCTIHRTKPDWIREKNYFFRLSKYQDRLLKHFAAQPDFLVPDIRRNEILRLIEGGLEDISVSRAGQSWGIPMPQDPSSVVYVWFDALINYISAVGLGTDDGLLKTWWPANLHVIGKDITRFHTVIWPAMLMSAGVSLPRQVFGHGWVHLKGEKMSKSLGTAVEPLDALKLFGPDPLRLYLVKEINWGSDGDFSWERYEDRYNVDLANNLGNLVSRIGAMAEKYRGGTLASSTASGRLRENARYTLDGYRARMEEFQSAVAMSMVFLLIDAANTYIAEKEPWKLANDPDRQEELSQVLFDVAEAVRIVGILLLPVMPASAAEILRRVGETKPIADIRLEDAVWRSEGTRTILKGDGLWPRAESSAAGKRDSKLESKRSSVVEESRTPPPPAAAPAAAPASPASAPAAADSDKISIDDFMKIDLRVAKVLTAEKVPNSRKLVKMTIDVGSEQRTLVAGIAEAYEPEQLVGRTIAMVFNLKPAKLMGIESNGMVLAASPEGGKPTLVSFDRDVPPGSRVR